MFGGEIEAKKMNVNERNGKAKIILVPSGILEMLVCVTIKLVNGFIYFFLSRQRGAPTLYVCKGKNTRKGSCLVVVETEEARQKREKKRRRELKMSFVSP